MAWILGFDPGGEKGFGWAILEDAETFPLRLVATGIADNASEAFAAVSQRVVPTSEHVIGAGIDAPLFWITSGDRLVDALLRATLCRLGAPSPGGTVQAVNSLRGACLAQGVMIAALLRTRWPNIPISESHPKVYLWLAGHASRDTHHHMVEISALSEFTLPAGYSAKDHERDAALAALSAWAMIHQAPTWNDLCLHENSPYQLVSSPLGYWMPAFSGT